MKRVILFFVLVLAGCGGEGTSTHPAKKTPLPPTFKITDAWRIVGKACGSRAAAVAPLEAYQFDSRYFGRIEKLSDDGTEVCRIGKFYTRVVTAFANDGAVYTESATLTAGAQKTVCQRRGQTKPTREVVEDFTTSPIAFALRLEGRNAEIRLDGMADCPGATLTLSLQRAR